jgi:preprotein translocase subunit SecF
MGESLVDVMSAMLIVGIVVGTLHSYFAAQKED